MYANKIEKFLDKPSSDFTKSDLIKFVEGNEIKHINFRHIGGDGRLKTLKFVINSTEYLDSILSTGERVDGSSLFSYLESDSSDLYVVPRYRTAFVNPFAQYPTLDILCYYYTSDGSRLASDPTTIMQKANETLLSHTGMSLEVFGELEYYVISQKEDLYKATDQKGYHESPPFTKGGFILEEALDLIADIGAKIKYGHSEVGNFSEGNFMMEQFEIEFNPNNLEDSADHLILTKWILRMLGYKHGVVVSFAPKITVGKAGSGLHIHSKLVKDRKNMMVEDCKLSDIAKKTIAGYLDIAPSLTAFGNTIPPSYLRLVPHQEAPTSICWGDRNRSVLVRVPLGWLGNAKNMTKDANPIEDVNNYDFSSKQTIEFRCPDGSANIHLLFAGLAVAARHGLEMENALEIAENLYVDVNIFKDENKKLTKKLKQLPTSCFESAKKLIEQSYIFTKYNVFTQGIIEDIADGLKKYEDKGLSEKLFGKQADIKQLVDRFIHYS